VSVWRPREPDLASLRPRREDWEDLTPRVAWADEPSDDGLAPKGGRS
jgi:hypothetical protein